MREQRKVVTVLFCDLVGSTALGESSDPEVLRARMRRYFDDIRAVVERHGGRVEKFVGDAVMAVFGIPTAHEDDALRAVRAASEMLGVVAAHGLEARIGVNSGEVVVGDETETLVTGDAVNVGARLEQSAAAGEILVGAETRLLVRDAVSVEPVGPLLLKGKSAPVDAFRLVELAGHEALARQLETPLVGRERERRRLWRDYEDAVADRTCRLFTLLGPAGIGKSRLVADFLERLGDSADVLRGRCLSYGEGITYWPLVEMLAPLGIDPESIVTSTPEETRVAFRRLLGARAAERPQVVVVDDLQWAEPIFVDLVEHVADLSRGAPIFLLCIARTELLDARPDWAGGKLNATSLLLEPLDVEERTQLIEQLASGAALDTLVRDRISAASGGNPLFVEEMLAMMRERGGEALAIPPSIHALLQARIDLLEPDVRVVIEAGAVEGEVFHRGAVSALVPDELRTSLETHLSGLVRKELVHPDGSLIPGEDAYRFRHILIRDAAYGAMSKELRATLHEKLSGWLERAETPSTFEQDEILGYHLEQAVRLRGELGRTGAAEGELAARAGERLVAAGRRALGRSDVSAAAGLLRRGLDLLPTGSARLEALPDLGVALARSGELEEAETALHEAIADSREAGHRSVEVHARITLSRVRTRVDSAARNEDELRESLEIAGSLEPSDFPNLARVYTEIGSCRFMLGHAGEGEVDLENAAAFARRARDSGLERAALIARLRPIAWGPTPAADGIAFCGLLVDSDLTTQADKSSALQVRALFQAMRGDVDGARRSGSRAWELIEEFGLRLQRGIYSIDVGFAELLAGDLERAEGVLRQGHELLLDIGDVGVRSTVDGILSEVLYRGGRDDEALQLAEEARAIAGPDDLDSQPRWRVSVASVLSRRGEHAEALELVQEAVELVEPIDFLSLKAHVHDVLGEVVARMGRTEEAAAAFAQAVSFHEQKGNVVSAERSRAALGGLRAPP